MTVRQTSIDCYNEIVASGLLSAKRLEVYGAILKNAPCTSAEAVADSPNAVMATTRARLTELRELGVIYEKGEKLCSISKRNVIEWDLTDLLPQGRRPGNSRKQQRTAAAINALRELYKARGTASREAWINVARLINEI